MASVTGPGPSVTGPGPVVAALNGPLTHVIATSALWRLVYYHALLIILLL